MLIRGLSDKDRESEWRDVAQRIFCYVGEILERHKMINGFLGLGSREERVNEGKKNGE